MKLWVVLLLVAPLVLTGCIRDVGPSPPENHVSLREIAVSAPEVSSANVRLVVNLTLDNRFAQSEPVRVVVEAFDLSTGLRTVVNQTRVQELPAERSVPVEVELRVSRASGYRLEVEVFEQGRIVQQGQVTVRNVGALEPTLHDTGLAIEQMDFIVRNVSQRQVAIDVRTYLANEHETDSPPVRMQVKARDIDTRLLADERWVPLEPLSPEKTHIRTVQLEVPDAHNYVVEVALWYENRTVERGQDTVQLLPTITKPADQDLVVSDPRVEDFIRRDDRTSAGDRGGEHAEDVANSPAIGVVAAVALVALTAVVRRWRR